MAVDVLTNECANYFKILKECNIPNPSKITINNCRIYFDWYTFTDSEFFPVQYEINVTIENSIANIECHFVEDYGGFYSEEREPDFVFELNILDLKNFWDKK
jgi:hypothetical protein